MLCLLAFGLQAQTVLYTTNFDNASEWELGSANNFDTWTINNTYNCSNPTPDAGGGKYMHIYNDLDGEMCAYAAYYGIGGAGSCFASMKNPINTVGQSEVTITFDWLCKGQSGALPTYGKVEYSTNGGATWTQITSPRSQYNNQTSWTSASISSSQVPGLLNQSSLKLRFGWVNSAYGTNPAFAVDNLKIEGRTGSCTNVGGTISPSVTSVCSGQTVGLSLTGSSGSILWQSKTSQGDWVNISNNNSTANFTTAPLTENTQFRAVLGADGCPDQYSDIVSVQVSPLMAPTISFQPLGQTVFCEGDTVLFAASFTNGGSAPEVFWRFGNAFIHTDTLSAIAIQQNNSSVIQAFIVSNALCRTADTIASTESFFWVQPRPEVSLTLPELFCKGASSLALTGGLPEGGTYTGTGVADNAFDLNQEPGTFVIQYQYTNTFGCSASVADTVELAICTITDEVHPALPVLYPCPADERGFTLKTAGERISSINVYSADGKLVRTYKNSGLTEQEISNLDAGFYFLSVQTEHRSFVIQGIIQ